MGFFDYPAPKTIKHWLGWVLRPRLTYLRIREARHARNAPPVRNDLNLSALPIVTLRLAETPEDLALVVDLYRRNPSNMTISPRSTEAIEKLLARNVEFYRIFDSEGEYVGNIGFQVARRIMGYAQIEYSRRSGGLILAATVAMEKSIAQRGIDIVYVQIYRINRRALSTFLSRGYEIIEKQSTEEYFLLKKALIPPDNI